VPEGVTIEPITAGKGCRVIFFEQVAKFCQLLSSSAINVKNIENKDIIS
jgi:hypothetical protein